MSGRTTAAGLTFRSRMPTSVVRPTLTPAASASIHNRTGMNVNSIHNPMRAMNTRMISPGPRIWSS